MYTCIINIYIYKGTEQTNQFIFSKSGVKALALNLHEIDDIE